MIDARLRCRSFLKPPKTRCETSIGVSPSECGTCMKHISLMRIESQPKRYAILRKAARSVACINPHRSSLLTDQSEVHSTVFILSNDISINLTSRRCSLLRAFSDLAYLGMFLKCLCYVLNKICANHNAYRSDVGLFIDPVSF
jgi:hypothetical protein